MSDPMRELELEDLLQGVPKNLSFIGLANKTGFHVSLSAAAIVGMQKDLADPHKRWLVIGDEEEGVTRWISTHHIVEVRWVPDGT
jgi:hypothetical protein